MVKNDFISIAMGLKRPGIKNLVDYLESTDFFEAPASTRFHGSYPGGLVEHSRNTAVILKTLTDVNHLHWEDCESPYIIGLFHDICKANFYGIQMRNVKNEQTDKWEKKACYVVKEAFPLGHGEKSLYLISRFVQLTDEEAMCIRWHMGGYEPKEAYLALSKAKALYPNILWTHLADELECAEARMLRVAV